MDDFIYFYIIDFKLDNRSIFGKFGYIAGHPVAEAGPDSYDQVALRHGHIGSKGSMHTNHS